MRTRIDHLAVAARTLEEGVAWVERLMGVTPPKGGAHPRMGTHNHLLRLGDGLYLEVIAIDPAAPAPGRPRWFALDDPDLGRRLRSGPQLVAWVARTSSIHEAVARSPIGLGPVEPMSRGSLEWLITVPADGALREDGTMPVLIQWPDDGPHPADAMPDLGCRLLALDIRHPEPQRLQAALRAVGFEDEDGLVAIHATANPPHLAARIATPRGTVTIGPAGP